jgi:hypothetical protein
MRRRETESDLALGPMEPEHKRAKVEPLALSEMAPFYVGVYADGRSWGTRVHELVRYGYGDTLQTLDRWSSDDFRVTTEIGHGYFGIVLQASTSFHPNEPIQEVALKRISKGRILEEADRGNARPLELLRNEVLIHSS